MGTFTQAAELKMWPNGQKAPRFQKYWLIPGANNTWVPGMTLEKLEFSERRKI